MKIGVFYLYLNHKSLNYFFMKQPLFILLLELNFIANSQNTTEFITVDQLGYRAESIKKAVVRNPITGFDANLSYTPPTQLHLVESETQAIVYTANIIAWKNGNTDLSSGDQAWHFDFSIYKEPGKYYILDQTNNLKSYDFLIKEDVYQDVLKHAVRTFFYQRAGFAKNAPYAEAGWVDGASHVGPLQDKNARHYLSPNDMSTERDLSGGWYDAGDFNKYTSWTAGYILSLLQAYQENPSVWTDDYNIPESGNGTPDIIDEILWGLAHLERLQNENGSMISIVSLASGTPPSSATGQSLYGSVNTSSTLSSAGTFAFASKVLGNYGMTALADRLKERAEKAWDWADANPNVIWRNNDKASGTEGIGAGQQEMDDYGRLSSKIRASLYLFELTQKQKYHDYFLANYEKTNMFEWNNFVFPFQYSQQKTLLHYTTISIANSTVKQKILNSYKLGVLKQDQLLSHTYNDDPYLAHIKDYTWGSNSTKMLQGLIFTDIITHNVDATLNDQAMEAAEEFIHYIHGRNPLSLMYLSNMNNKGASNSVSQFYHSWFKNGSNMWDEVGFSTYGPAPGFLVGGPNPAYNYDNCCPNNCGSAFNNSKCSLMEPPKNQPSQKSYLDFNDNWPLNSWEITENSCGYQINYIHLLSYFVKKAPTVTSSKNLNTKNLVKIYPNSNNGNFRIESNELIENIEVFDIQGKLIDNFMINSNVSSFNLNLKPGTYSVKINTKNNITVHKIIIL